MSPESERDLWNRLADQDADYHACSVPVHQREANTVATIDELVPLRLVGDWQAPKVLELGCGPGRLLLSLAQMFPRVDWVGVDVSDLMVDIARHRSWEAQLENTTVLVGNGRTLPEIGWLTGAYSVACFQHLDRPSVRSYVQQVGWRLIDGGRFRFQYVAGNGHLDRDDFHGWCDEGGMTVVKVENSLVDPEWCWIEAVKR